MSIYYALVARGPIILVDFTEHNGNFEQITTKILQSIDTTKDSRCSYTSEKYVFHVMIHEGLVFLCMADDSLGKSLPYGYLAEIKTIFTKGTLKERAYHCNAYEMKYDFAPVLKQQMARFNRGDVDVGNNKIRNLQKDVDGVKSVMTENINKLIERGDKLNVLVDKTEDLSRSSESFAKSSKKLKRKMWWQNKKMCMILACVLFVIVAIITLVVLFEAGVFSASPSSGKTHATTTLPPPPPKTTKLITTTIRTVTTTVKPPAPMNTTLSPTIKTTIAPTTNMTIAIKSLLTNRTSTSN